MRDTLLAELESLLIDWESADITEDGVDRFREILRTDPDARRWYARQQVLGAALSLGGEPGSLAVTAGAHLPPLNVERNVPEPRRSRLSRWLIVTAVALLGGLTTRLLYLEVQGNRTEVSINEQPPGEKELTSRGIAIVTRLVDTEWASDQETRSVGDALTPGRFTIKGGFAQLEFFCGATVVLEGPAELDLKSASLARVVNGRLRAQVPPAARGFSLEVDDLKVVDLGTEFGLSVSATGATVQVFDGEVEVHGPNAAMQNIRAGEAISRDTLGAMETAELSPADFVGIAALESRERGQTEARFERWKSASATLRADRRVITYYAFDQKGRWHRRLKNSLEPADGELDGAIVGARRVAGRWISKGSLEFKQPADRVRVQIPGEYASLTFSAWVKIDSLDRQYNSLFLTDNYNQGEPHWQILDTGQLFFSVRAKADSGVNVAAKTPTHHIVLSPPFWEPSMSGRWVHLATTHDVAAGRVTHYLNGVLLHQEIVPEELLVDVTRIGAATIGNWSVPTRPDEEFAIRNLNGCIDEFVLFAAALSADEIHQMYEDGKP